VAWRSRRFLLSSLVGIGVLALLAAPLASRLSPATLSTDSSVLARVEAWKVAARLVAARPALGLGPDNFVVAFRPARTEEGVILARQELFDSTHNWLVYSATSAGVIGAVAICAFITLAFVAGVRGARSGSPYAILLVPLAAYLGQGLVDVNDVTLDWVMWLTAGGVAAAAPPFVGAWPRVQRPAGWSLGAAGALGLIALVIAAGTLPRIVASEYFKTAIAYGQEGNGSAAIENARAALNIDPRRAEYWNAFGNGLAVIGNASAAATAFADAAARAPWDPGYPRNIALQKVRLGDVAGATAAIERSVLLDPFDPVSLDIDARFAFNRGDYVQAAAISEKGIRIDPLVSSRYEVPVRAYLQLRRFDDAKRLLKSGFGLTGDLHLRVLLALTLFQANQRAESLQELSQVLASDPSNAEALGLRAQILAAP
jgi:Tfp pilus assembly protein PilF